MTRPGALLGVAAGTFFLLATANSAAAKPAQGRLPDLAVVKISKPGAALIAGQRGSLRIAIRNKGATPARRSRLAVYLASGRRRTAKSRRLGGVKVKRLRPGKRAKARVKLSQPAGLAPGSYRLIACADDRRRLHESREKNNCVASSRFRRSSAPAFSMTDGLDWHLTEGINGASPQERDPIAVTLRAGNALPGQSGYTRSSEAPQPLLTGETTVLDFSGQEDDGTLHVSLPFPFPFGGINETSVSVGTNGWINFDGGAADRWQNQSADFRGFEKVLGEFERAIMPYWADLNLVDTKGAGPGTIKMVRADDGGAVAFQWDLGQFGFGVPRRLFQLVLFPDGRFRFDYPGPSEPGGQVAFVGYSLATGTGGLDVVGADVEAVPSSSLLVTPNRVPVAAPSPAGEATLTLPADSAFLSDDPGCQVSKAPGLFTDGLATCTVPALAAGEQATRTVTFAMPNDAPGQGQPADVSLVAGYATGGLTLRDEDEINSLSNSTLTPTEIDLTTQYVSPVVPQVGVPAIFSVTVGPETGGLDQPRASFTLPANTTLSSIAADGDALDCDPPSAGQVNCRLPDGLNDTDIRIAVIPSAGAVGSKMTLAATTAALNAPAKSDTAESPIVE